MPKLCRFEQMKLNKLHSLGQKKSLLQSPKLNKGCCRHQRIEATVLKSGLRQVWLGFKFL